MKNSAILILFFVFISLTAQAIQPVVNLNGSIKSKLQAELQGLQNDLIEANGGIIRLKQDKLNIENNLKDMEAWGTSQQEEKLSYYNESVHIREDLANAENQIVEEQVRAAATLVKYHRIKSIMSYLAGGFLVLLYFRFGSPVLSAILGVLNPAASLLYVAAPVGVFGAGYLAVYLMF
jgi:VIT1/CCC1 family predicted Fe2+/Mn2+ transporter